MIASIEDFPMDYWLNVISSNPNKKHYRVKHALHIINQEISDLRFNALKKTGGQYAAYLMGHQSNFLEKQLREVLS
jgi:DNA gyrase inhibitor GyrI